jgi:hypothetical protein
MMGYALLTTAMNQPFGFPDDYTDNETNPDALDFETLLQVSTYFVRKRQDYYIQYSI